MIVRPTRRDVLRYGSAAMLAALPAPAIAQAWPSKPIKIIVTYPAGRELCRAYVAGAPERFRRLLTEQVRVGELRDAPAATPVEST